METATMGAPTDLFGAPTLVALERPVDRARPCCRNICIIGAPRGPRAGELICADCGRHRGWLSKPAAQQIAQATRLGVPTTPIVVCARAHVTIEKGDDQLTRIRKIHEGFKKLGELTNADWVLEHAREGDFDPLLEHLRRGGDIPAEMKHFLASTIDALLQRKPVRKSKPVTAAISLRNYHIACFVLQLEDWGVPPSGAQKAASERFCLNMRSVQDIAKKGRDEARALLSITKGIFGPDYDKEWELANWGLTKDDVAALAAPQSKRRSR